MARSTFKVLFYVNGSKEKNGIVPIMGRVTINGTVAQFSCKRAIPKELWDAKGNKAKGKSMEARETNLALDNIKAQIIKHYQRISDREAYVTAEMVRNAYQGLGGEYETLLDGFIRKKANGEAHYSSYSDDLMHSYPDFKFFVVDINTTSKGDTLSNNLQNAVDLSFQAIEPLELNFKKEISKKESSKRVEKIAPRFKAAKEVLTQDEKAYIDRLTQALTYNFLYAQ